MLSLIFNYLFEQKIHAKLQNITYHKEKQKQND